METTESPGDFTFDEWVKWSFEKYSNGNQVLDRHQAKLAIISLTGKKVKLGEQKLYTLGDLRKMVRSFSMSTFLSNVNQIYEEIDKEQNGFVRLKDLYENAQMYCPSVTPFLEEAFNIVDADGDGMISYKEFISTIESGFKNISPGT
jgi:uncharacterized membrane-anchored protein